MVKTIVRTPRAKKRKKRSDINAGVPRKKASPDPDVFIPLSQVPDTTSSPEHECLMHTTSVISRGIQKRLQRVCAELTRGEQNESVPAACKQSDSRVDIAPPNSDTTIPTAVYVPVAHAMRSWQLQDW